VEAWLEKSEFIEAELKQRFCCPPGKTGQIKRLLTCAGWQLFIQNGLSG